MISFLSRLFKPAPKAPVFENRADIVGSVSRPSDEFCARHILRTDHIIFSPSTMFFSDASTNPRRPEYIRVKIDQTNLVRFGRWSINYTVEVKR